MMIIANPNPVTKSALFRLANLSRRRGEKLLRELGVQPCGMIGTSQIFPPQTIGQLVAAAAQDKTPAPQI